MNKNIPPYISAKEIIEKRERAEADANRKRLAGMAQTEYYHLNFVKDSLPDLARVAMNHAVAVEIAGGTLFDRSLSVETGWIIGHHTDTPGNDPNYYEGRKTTYVACESGIIYPGHEQRREDILVVEVNKRGLGLNIQKKINELEKNRISDPVLYRIGWENAYLSSEQLIKSYLKI